MTYKQEEPFDNLYTILGLQLNRRIGHTQVGKREQPFPDIDCTSEFPVHRIHHSTVDTTHLSLPITNDINGTLLAHLRLVAWVPVLEEKC